MSFWGSGSRLLFQSLLLLLSSSGPVCEADRAFSRAVLRRLVALGCFCFGHARLVATFFFGDGTAGLVTLDCWLRLTLSVLICSVRCFAEVGAPTTSSTISSNDELLATKVTYLDHQSCSSVNDVNFQVYWISPAPSFKERFIERSSVPVIDLLPPIQKVYRFAFLSGMGPRTQDLRKRDKRGSTGSLSNSNSWR